MHYPRFLSVWLSIAAVAFALSLKVSDVQAHPCTVEPVFHCAEVLDDGSAIGHFGYRMVCPPNLVNIADLDIPIGKNNAFSPGPTDRGQPRTFAAGDHVDEFEVEFPAEEIKESGDIRWNVMDREVQVDFSRTADALYNCTSLP